MSNATEIFEEIRAAIPHTVNVFVAIESIITSKFYPVIPRSFDYQLWALCGVFAL